MKTGNPARSIPLRLLKYHLPVILYATLILYLSSLPNLRQPQIFPFSLDKVAHMVEYALFAWLVFRSFRDLLPARMGRLVVLCSIVYILLFAYLDELYQGTIKGRQQDHWDLMADFVGALVVIYLLARKKVARKGKTAHA